MKAQNPVIRQEELLLSRADFAKSPDGLLPAIVQDANTGAVLMLGYMNLESLSRTLAEKMVVFYSRSRKRLWKKGEESGHFLQLREVLLDCDNDTLLVKAIPTGPVCHTGADTCFGRPNQDPDFLENLGRIIADRRTHPGEHSYTSRLFARGINKIAQKVGEEAVELVIEAMDDDRVLFLNEAADLLFHYMVLLEAKGYRLQEVREVLRQRHLEASPSNKG